MDYSKLTTKKLQEMIQIFKKQEPKLIEELFEYQQLYQAVSAMEIFAPKVCKEIYNRIK
jgi:predicted choloylglycine hydrolase